MMNLHTPCPLSRGEGLPPDTIIVNTDIISVDTTRSNYSPLERG